MRPDKWIYTLPLRLRSLFRRRDVDRELDEELRYHIERKTEENLARGMTSREARRAALLEIGGIERRKEECRDTRRVTWLQDFAQDLRYGIRMLRKSPGFTAVAVLTLALGIGATTGLFSVVNAVLIRALPFRDPQRLVALFQSPNKSKGLIGIAADGPDILDWERDGHSFSDVAASLLDAANIIGGRVPQHVNGEKVTANYFDLLGVRASIGRTFSRDNEQSGQSEVILSYALWRTSFGGQNILGRTIALDGQPFTVIGVMPALFHDPRTWANPQSEYWILLPRTELAKNRGEHMYASLGRLAPNVTLAQAQQEMDLIGDRDARAFPNTNEGMGVRVSPLEQVNLQTFEEGHFQSVRPAILLLQLAAGFLLLIACANVASLMLSKSLERHKEFALRAAMGAGRWRIIRQLLTESVLLSLLASGVGIVLAVWCAKALLALAPEGYLPPTVNIHLDLSVLAFALCIAAATGISFGLLPALRVSRKNLNEDLKRAILGAGDSRSRVRIRGALVVLELSATFVLLAGGGLMVRSLASLLAVNAGFNPQHFFTAGLSLPAQQYSKPEQIVRFFTTVQQRVRNLPGITDAAFTSAPEFEVTSSSDIIVEGHSAEPPGFREVWAQICVITPDFFRAAGIPLLQGRDFSRADIAREANVAIVSRSFAEHLWPHQNWLGKRVRFGNEKVWREIVGIVGDVRQEGLAASSLPEIYFPLVAEMADGENAMNIVVRSAVPPVLLTQDIGQQVASVDSGVPLSEVRSGKEILQEWSGYLRYRTVLLTSFALIALLIAAIGLFSAICYTTTRRTHEIGIRIALGAQRHDVFGLVMLQGVVLILVGLGLGIMSALALARLITSFVYGVTPSDPITFVGVSILLVLVALAACYIPARRAMRVDPMVALRHD
ncbi:MAG TPA: ABC transporter permease [Candidatus Acidoferrales bacterium]|nr:ABC transporter permease [Candidatus Acidoferrales bacterium]